VNGQGGQNVAVNCENRFIGTKLHERKETPAQIRLDERQHVEKAEIISSNRILSIA
jgi:hypothetical protein